MTVTAFHLGPFSFLPQFPCSFFFLRSFPKRTTKCDLMFKVGRSARVSHQFFVVYSSHQPTHTDTRRRSTRSWYSVFSMNHIFSMMLLYSSERIPKFRHKKSSFDSSRSQVIIMVSQTFSICSPSTFLFSSSLGLCSFLSQPHSFLVGSGVNEGKLSCDEILLLLSFSFFFDMTPDLLHMRQLLRQHTTDIREEEKEIKTFTHILFSALSFSSLLPPQITIIWRDGGGRCWWRWELRKRRSISVEKKRKTVLAIWEPFSLPLLYSSTTEAHLLFLSLS